MHPESWTTVRRLLLCSGYAPSPSLLPVVQHLQASLPQAELDLWVTAPPPHLSLTEQVTFIPNWLDPSVIEQLHQPGFDAAIILTVQGQSPYSIAYACYLAGIPTRVGYSAEFGGGVLSTCIQPPSNPLGEADYHLHLLGACGVLQLGDRPEPATVGARDRPPST